MTEGDHLDAETLLAQLVFVLPKPFIPDKPSKAYLKERVRVALFTMLRKIHMEGVFLDARSHLYKRSCPSVRRSVVPSFQRYFRR